MRIEPSEDDMYKRMDKRDRMMILIPACGVVASMGLFIAAAGLYSMLGIILIGLGSVAMGISAVMYMKMKKLVMPMRSCYMEIRTDCFVAIQPYKDGKYESCRVFFKEIENLIKDKNGGGFYLMTVETGKSIIKIGKECNRRRIFISAFGYGKEKTEGIYRVIKERLPESAEIYEYER